MSILLEKAIAALLVAGAKLAAEPAQKTEIYYQLLKKLDLTPENLKADFDHVYVFALAEYGLGKPEAVLRFFRFEKTKDVAKSLFDDDDLEKARSAITDVVRAYKVGDDIRSAGIDVNHELEKFLEALVTASKRSRTPAQVRADVQLGRLETKIDRLLSPAPPPIRPSLEQQLHDWFAALGYERGSYHRQTIAFFEYELNVPQRRGFDRVLIRGLQGEIETSDVSEAHSVAAERHLDEVWLVTDRRISPSASRTAEQLKQPNIYCYTLDSLIDLDADFSNYFTWLEREVQQRDLLHYYVPLGCNKREFDHQTGKFLGVSHYNKEIGWIDGYLDQWLDDPAKEHISILGEFGTGKTWVVLHYAWKLYQRYLDAKKRGIARPRIPLVIPLRDYAKAVTIESLFSEFFFRKHELKLRTYKAFEQLNRMGKLLLLFDGFDEMSARVDRQRMINNFWELAKVVQSGSKAILTCRSEHFPEAMEGRALLSAELQASTKLLTGQPPQFEILELDKFEEPQLREVLSRRTTLPILELILKNSALRDLARRPVMAELILEALPEIEAGKPIALARIYLYAVQRKLERDIKQERTFTSMADKVFFLCEIAWEMLSTDRMTINYREFPERIRNLFGNMVQQEKDLDHWHYDMMGQTILVRNDDGDYTPAHRSLLEFFVAYKFTAELGVLDEDALSLARQQSHVDQSQRPVALTWEQYFRRTHGVPERGPKLPPLGRFAAVSFERLKETFGFRPLSNAVWELMLDLFPKSKQEAIEILKKNIFHTRCQDRQEVGYVGGNALTLLSRITKITENLDLSRTILVSADLNHRSFQNCNFSGADLSGSELTESGMMNCSLNEAKFIECVREERRTISSSMRYENTKIFIFYNISIHRRRDSQPLAWFSGNPYPSILTRWKPKKGSPKPQSAVFVLNDKEDRIIRFWTFMDICMTTSIVGNMLYLGMLSRNHISIDLALGRQTDATYPYPLPWSGTDITDAVGFSPKQIQNLVEFGAIKRVS